LFVCEARSSAVAVATLNVFALLLWWAARASADAGAVDASPPGDSSESGSGAVSCDVVAGVVTAMYVANVLHAMAQIYAASRRVPSGPHDCGAGCPADCCVEHPEEPRRSERAEEPSEGLALCLQSIALGSTVFVTLVVALPSQVRDGQTLRAPAYGCLQTAWAARAQIAFMIAVAVRLVALTCLAAFRPLPVGQQTRQVLPSHPQAQPPGLLQGPAQAAAGVELAVSMPASDPPPPPAT
jgi:hypothetical protein